MKTMTSLFLIATVATVAAAAGCEKKEDPRARPGFVDTSDPGKVGATMTPPPKAAKGGSAGAGAGPAPSQSKP